MKIVSDQNIRSLILGFKKGKSFNAREVDEKHAIIPSAVVRVMNMMRKQGELEVERPGG